MGSEKFIQWVSKSKVRAKMLLEADQNYDYETGSDLLSEYEELFPQSADNEADPQEEEKLEEDLKALTTEKKSKSKGTRKKIYSRAQIVEMAINDPEQYEGVVLAEDHVCTHDGIQTQCHDEDQFAGGSLDQAGKKEEHQRVEEEVDKPLVEPAKQAGTE